MSQVPYIPSSAPFTPEQRAWLNGFLTGLFADANVAEADVSSGRPAGASVEKPEPLLVMYGSQTGTAEQLARRFAKDAEQRGFAPRVMELNAFGSVDFAKETRLIIVTSTWGDGDPPDNAAGFWQYLSSEAATQIDHLSYSVLALGDKTYSDFCGAGKKFDDRLEQLGARRIHPRAECDVDYEATARAWMESVWAALAATCNNPPTSQRESKNSAATGGEVAAVEVPVTTGARSLLPEAENPFAGLRPSSPAASSAGANRPELSSVSPPEDGRTPLNRDVGGEQGKGRLAPTRLHPGPYNRTHPFPARVITNRKLNAAGSAKDTRHIEVSLDGSGLTYEVGDALGVIPTNCPALVNDILQALGFDGEEAVPDTREDEISLRQALLTRHQITQPSIDFLKAVAECSGDTALKSLLEPARKTELDPFLRGREIVDFLSSFSAARFEPSEFVALLRKLQPRLYSIASSPKAHPGEVHLTVGVVRYGSHGRQRKGVCSTFLADRVELNLTPLPVFVQPSHGFRLPAEGDRPIVMIGPGTGIAPFRAFLEERRALGARGRSWVFFGDQCRAHDFLYGEELEAMLADGALTRLDTAFSRDQREKIYVQHRMLENARELWEWLEAGAHIYVCGDASRMAKDVDAALHDVIQKAGGKDAAQAAEYVRGLKSVRRYQRDVY
jgi:sulfite reductase (NADPH) flavoprotein alpha-component